MEPPLSVCQRLLRVDADGGGSSGPWLVLSDAQRASLSQRGFVVVDGLAPANLAAEAYEEVGQAEVAMPTAPPPSPSGSLKSRSNFPEDEGQEGEGGLEATAGAAAEVTGYVKSVRDDLTAFDAEVGAVGRTLAILARLGEDLGRMVRLKGRVEHQLAVYPTGINARYERHRDAYPDDGEDEDDGSQSG
ncbi:unnamed protein product, partial [Scytosiphon promiscuus]